MIRDPKDIRDTGLLKYYRLTRKWACKQYNITEPELELLMFLHAERRFTAKKFKDGEYLLSWDKNRWLRLRKQGWISVWREGDNKYNKAWIYTTSRKCNEMLNRIYSILLGREDIPSGSHNAFYQNKTYTDKVMNKSIDDMIKDKNR